MAKTDDTLKALRRAARRKAEADAAFRAALEAADAAGTSYADMADAAETSRQRVRQLLTYRPR